MTNPARTCGETKQASVTNHQKDCARELSFSDSPIGAPFPPKVWPGGAALLLTRERWQSVRSTLLPAFCVLLCVCRFGEGLVLCFGDAARKNVVARHNFPVPPFVVIPHDATF